MTFQPMRRTAVAVALLASALSATAQTAPSHAEVAPLVNSMYASLETL